MSDHVSYVVFSAAELRCNGGRTRKRLFERHVGVNGVQRGDETEFFLDVVFI